MENSPILQPVVALIIWTMVMWIWMYATRLPAMSKAEGLDAANMVGGKGSDLDNVLPANVQWKAHNYNHLLEQPTLFYAVCIVLALVGAGDGLNSVLAWAYVGLRVVHSLVQATVNRVVIRFGIFALSSLCLMALALHAAIAVFH
ncbi:MAPEG family protein [Parasphingorhabdus halotolerans]|uniref:MAPEG family protein n=1 Tax=Parasphingorhabdus halotolerans TaxID=2725558 RepID=A0A6H2DK33_9SPHN|nr:MAPEG family protein [Parasphingorhabdus halotolerans]QJB68305.1 MAPEG family protein [Parasphingorhabdus halotolerans]